MGWVVLLVALAVAAFPAVFCAVQSRRAPCFLSAGIGSVAVGFGGILWGAVMFDVHRDSMNEFDMALAFVFLPVLMGVAWAIIGAYAGAAVVSVRLGSRAVRERMILGAVVGLAPVVMYAFVHGPARGTDGFGRALDTAIVQWALFLGPLAGSLAGALIARRK